MSEKGVYTISIDEKTGIQAIERKEVKPMNQGYVQRVEHNYIRHGTLCLTANLDVVSGRIISPSITQTRKEDDFLKHIQNLIRTDPKAEWKLIVDNLNTHKSESLVKWIASEIGDEMDLGIKGRKGILKSLKSRAAFLSNENHRIRFLYTPKHTSWLNQIEVWFSILVKRLLKRSSFKSKEELKQRLLDFIHYFNKVMAKPFKWRYKGTVGD